MHFSKIKAATVPSLFDVYHDNASLCGRSGKTGPRAAVAQEIRAYAAWLASKAGLYPFNTSEVIGGGIAWRSRHHEPVMGVTYGEQRGRNAETREYEYEQGSYSIPFPGRNAHRDTVTFETLDDDGNVIASSCLPVEPKKGGVVWDRDAVRKAAGKVAKPSRGKPATPLSAEIDDRAENLATETQEPVAVADDAREAVALLSEPEIAPQAPCATECEKPADLSTAPGLADQVAALASMVEEMRGQLAALKAAPPVEGMTAAPPVSGKRERTAAHERAIRRAWKHRRESRLRRSIAEDHMRMRDQVQAELRQTSLEALQAAVWKSRQRRRAILFARDLQKRMNEARMIASRHRDARNDADDRANGLACDLLKETRRADEATKDALRVSDILRERDAEIATLKARPHHMGQEIKPDDYQRLIRERDEARASLASDREKLRIIRANLERGTDALDMMTDRALRAENALRAVEQRQARAEAPYRANVRAVTFGRAA
jgi:hypothetical protein